MNEVQSNISQETTSLAKASRLFNKNYLLLWQGQFISRLGNQTYMLAMVLWITSVFSEQSAPTIISMLFMSAGIPAVILSVFGGAIADRYSRKKIIVYSDIINGLAILGLAAVFFLMPGHVNIILVGIFVVNILAAILGSFFTPAISAAIPDIVPQKRIETANSMGQFSIQTAQFFGYGLGGILFKLIGAPLLVLIDGLTFLFSAFSESFIKIPQVFPEKTKNTGDQYRKFKQDIKEGLNYIFTNPGLKKLLYVSVFSTFFSTPIGVLMIFFVKHVLQANHEVWYGPILVLYGVGTFVGYLIVGIARLRGKKRRNTMIAFMILQSAGYILLGLARDLTFTLILVFAGGIVFGFVVANITALLQLTTPSKIRGRVFGALTTISGSIAPLAAGLAGPLAEVVGLENIYFIFIGSGIILVLLSLIIAMSRDFRIFISYTSDEEEEPTGFSYTLTRMTSNELLKGVHPSEIYIESRIQKSRSEL